MLMPSLGFSTHVDEAEHLHAGSRSTLPPEAIAARKLERYLPELEAYHARHGVLKPCSIEISPKASFWARSIKSGQNFFLAEYKERLERLGLLTDHSRQCLRPGEKPVAFVAAQRRQPAAEKIELNLSELEAFCAENGCTLTPFPKEISAKARSWARNIKTGATSFSPEYAQRLEKLGLLSEKSISVGTNDQRNLVARRARFRANCEAYSTFLQAVKDGKKKPVDIPKPLKNWVAHVRLGNTSYDPEYLPAMSLNIITDKSKPFKRPAGGWTGITP